MPKTKRRKKQEAQEADAPRLKCRVKTWVTADGANKGFGFLDCFEEGAACSGIFVHKSEIGDGSALVVGSEVTVGALHADLKKPGAFRAVRVSGGVCFDFASLGHCAQGARCRFSHAARAVTQVSAAEAARAVQSHRSGPPPLLVDTVEACKEQCARLKAAGTVACDFEGVDLCRNGELLLAQLAAETGPVVLVDIWKLGAAAFEEGGLKALLECPSCTKLIFDGRSDSDALFHLWGVRLAAVCDCQVLFVAHLEGVAKDAQRVENLPSLARALQSCPSIARAESQALGLLKSAVGALFAPDRGGSYEVWRQRPMPAELLEYAAADVAFLHTLRREWRPLLADERMAEITSARIQAAVGGASAAKGAHMKARDFEL